MALDHLALYLNDHLAGSVVAVELLDHLEHSHKGTPIAGFASELRTEIQADRQDLVRIMGRLEIAQSPVRKVAAWFSEKLTEVKLKLEDLHGDRLRLLEILDALSLGIEGKRLLWRALATGAENEPGLLGTDYTFLERRAEDQRARVESHRLHALKAVLEPLPETK